MKRSISEKLIASIITVAMLLSAFGAIGVLAEREYAAEFLVGGVAVDFKNAPYSRYDTVFFPLEELCGYLNLPISRNTDTYTITRMGDTVKAEVNNMVCERNGETLLLQSPLTERNGVVYASVELLSLGFNIPVSLSENKRSADITPNIYNVYIDEEHAAAISAASTSKDTLATGDTETDQLYYDNPTSPDMEKSLYYMIDLSPFKDKDIVTAELVTTIGKGSNLYPTLGMVRTALWDKATISYNNQPAEMEETIPSKMLGDLYKQSAKNYAPMVHDITSVAKNAMIEGGMFSLKLLGKPYNHQKAVTQVFVQGVNTATPPYVQVTLNESFSFPAKKTEDNFAEDGRYTKISLLRGLGIFTAEDEFPVEGNVPVSRSEFLTYALRLRGNDIPAGGSEQFFSDVPVDAPYFSTVMSAYELGYIAGWKDIAFRPDDAITIGEAVTILGRMLNYDLYANQYGGFTPGYFSAASKGGLYYGSNSETALLSFEKMVELLEDSLDASMLEETVFTPGVNVTYVFNEDKTILSEFWNAKKIEGAVTANEYSNLTPGTDGEEGYIQIGGKKLKLSHKPYNEFLGYKVRGWYNDENELLYMGIIDGKIEDISISDIEGISESSSAISYTYVNENGNRKTDSFSKDATVIYNGKSVERANITKELLIADSGSVRKVGESLVTITAYRSVVVYSTDYDEEAIYDIYDAYDNVIRLKNAQWSLKNEEGKALTLENVHPGNVISVASSLDGKVISGIVSAKSISGKISMIENAGTPDEVLTVNGSEFKTANRIEAWTKYICLGADGIFYIDAFNNVVGFEANKTEEILGYIITADYAGNSALSPTLQAAIMVQTSEEYKVYDFADKVKIDGEPFDNSEDIRAYFTDEVADTFKPQGIIFDLNAEGKINNIDTAYCNADYEKQENTLYRRDTEAIAYKSHGEVGGIYNMDFTKGMVVYQYGEIGELDEYETVKSLTNDKKYEFEMYTIGMNTPFIKIAKLVGTRGSASVGYSASLIVADRVAVAYDENGYEVKKFYYHSDDKGVKSVIVSEDFDAAFTEKGVSRGDIVRIATDSKDELAALNIIYDYETRTIDPTYNKIAISSFNTQDRTMGGYTTNVLEDHIRVSMDPTDNPEADYAWINHSRFSSRFFKYEADSSGVTVSAAKLSDVRESEEVPYNPTGILIQTAYTNLKGNVWLIDMPQPENTGIYKVSYAKGAEDETIAGVADGFARYNAGDIVTVTDTVPTRTDHDFMGWSANGNILFAGDTFTVSGDTVITATWAYNPTLTFTFNDEEGIAPSIIREWALNDLDGNSVTRKLPTEAEATASGFTKTGYKLMGWKLGSETFLPGDDFTPTQAENFTAIWHECWSGSASTLLADAPELVDGYYQIDSGEDLAWFANLVNGKLKDETGAAVAANVSANAKLTGDIYLNYFEKNGAFDTQWFEETENVTAANSWYNYRMTGFKGTFEGNGKTIYGFYTKGTVAKTGGLFSTAVGATIKNFTMQGTYLVSTAATNSTLVYLAPVVGEAGANTTISGITTNGKMGVDEGCYMNAAGGIAGYLLGAHAEGCISNMHIDLTGCGTSVWASSNVVGTEDQSYGTKIGIGGICAGIGVGSSVTPTIKNCTNNGEIYAPYSTRVGGIMGGSYSYLGSTQFVNVINNATVTGNRHEYGHVGKIAGFIRYFNYYRPANDATTGSGTVVLIDTAAW